MIFLRKEDGAEKCAFLDFLREEETKGLALFHEAHSEFVATGFQCPKVNLSSSNEFGMVRDVKSFNVPDGDCFIAKCKKIFVSPSLLTLICAGTHHFKPSDLKRNSNAENYLPCLMGYHESTSYFRFRCDNSFTCDKC
jgi:hypothetical protein